jgi:hypothetical protein
MRRQPLNMGPTANSNTRYGLKNSRSLTLATPAPIDNIFY